MRRALLTWGRAGFEGYSSLTTCLYLSREGLRYKDQLAVALSPGTEGMRIYIVILSLLVFSENTTPYRFLMPALQKLEGIG